MEKIGTFVFTSEDVGRVATHFYCGKFSEVLKSLGKAPLLKEKNPELWAFQIGALVFTGELLEAQALYELALKHNRLSTPENVAQVRFFIGIGLVRTSRYSEACKIFARNLSDLKKIEKKQTAHWAQSFYAYQGAAFFRFFHGNFKISRRLAEKSYLSAFAGNFHFGLAFSSELMGHCNCHLGEIHKGLSDFKKAIGFAEKVGNGGLASAFKIAAEKFKAQHGIDLKNSEKLLLKALKTLNTEDTYSKSELYLELARQYVLRGKASAAKDLLDENAECIYKHQNRRQSATFNLRYAHILHLQGESKAALALLRSSRGNLVKAVDVFYLRQLSGLEEKITQEIYKDSRSELQDRKFLSYIDERIFARTNRKHKISIRSGEDPIGDALDAAQGQSLDLTELQRSGLLGLVPTLLNQRPSSTFIYLGPSRGEMILHSKGDLHWVAEGLSQPMLKILQALEGGQILSKESLVKKVWAYEYRPERHDTLLQATIAKLRKILGPFCKWIEWNTGGYSLKSEVKILSKSSTVRPMEKNLDTYVPEPPVIAPTPTSNELNARQIQLLRKLKVGNFIGVSDYSKQYKVCKMTACRDLTELWKKNMLVRYGRARATQYTIEGTQK